MAKRMRFTRFAGVPRSQTWPDGNERLLSAD